MKSSWPNLRHYPRSCLEGLRKTMKNSKIGTRDRDLKPVTPKYEVGVLTTRPRRLWHRVEVGSNVDGLGKKSINI
jgi:hypothetical protein